MFSEELGLQEFLEDRQGRPCSGSARQVLMECWTEWTNPLSDYNIIQYVQKIQTEKVVISVSDSVYTDFTI